MAVTRAWENWINEYITTVEKTLNDESSLSPKEAGRLSYLRNLLEAGLGTKTTISEDNRRLELRIPTKVEVTLSSAEKEWRGTTVNISVWGMYIEIEDPPPMGSKVDVQIGTGEQVTVMSSEVMWSANRKRGNLPPGVGIRLDSIKSETHAIYRAFCHRKLKDRLYENLG